MNDVKEKLANIPIEDLAYSRLPAYIATQFNGYRFWKHNLMMAAVLQKVESGEINRLILNIPPRHGKSMMVGEFFPAWYLGRNPNHHIIYATYSFERASDVGRKVRNQMIMPSHKKIFPGCQISKDAAGQNRMVTEQDGYYFAVGTGGVVIGRGAHCIHGDTEITTDRGNLKVSEIADIFIKNGCNTNIKALSLDEDKGLVYNKIEAYSETFNDTTYEIKTNSGNYIRTTGEHRFFIQGQGYKAAKNLRPGDTIISVKSNVLQNMWQKISTSQCIKGNVFGMLQPNAFFKDRNNLFMVPEKNNEDGLRNQKSNQTWTQRSLLFSKMFKKPSRHKESAKMRDMRKCDTEENNEVLFGFLQKTVSEKKKNIADSMQIMWKKISAAICAYPILFQALPECGTFQTDDGAKQFQLQEWKKLSKNFFRNKTVYFRAGLKFLCSLFSRKKSKQIQDSNTPYRRKLSKQYSTESDHPLQTTPYYSSQIKSDTISMVRRICHSKIKVYDLQVAKTNNFFANKILVHNCFIIDDPIKGREEADSETFRRKVIDWYRGVAYTRLMPDNKIIIIQTRWHYDDLTGYVMEEMKHEGWAILSLPAVCEDSQDPLGREIGEALWPGDYPKDRLDVIKKTVGTREWNAQYQQQPLSSTDSMVDLDWFGRYPGKEMVPVIVATSLGTKPPKQQLEKLGIVRIVQSWDTAFKEKELNDPSACTIWGVTKERKCLLLHTINKRMNYPKLKKKVVDTWHKWMKCDVGPIPVLIEDKASGQSLIQDLKRMGEIPIIVIKPDANKQIRMSTASPLIESGSVLLPDVSYDWIVDYETQIARFPLGRHDDLVDSTSQFLLWANRPKFKHFKSNKFWK